MSVAGLFLIGLGGALWSILRALIAVTVKSNFPWGTLLANFVGCLIIGLVIGHESVTADWAHHTRGFVVVGFCGGFTTFSTFSLQTIKQLEAGDLIGAVSNILLSLVVCSCAVWGGIKIAKWMFQGG